MTHYTTGRITGRGDPMPIPILHPYTCIKLSTTTRTQIPDFVIRFGLHIEAFTWWLTATQFSQPITLNSQPFTLTPSLNGELPTRPPNINPISPAQPSSASPDQTNKPTNFFQTPSCVLFMKAEHKRPLRTPLLVVSFSALIDLVRGVSTARRGDATERQWRGDGDARGG